MQNTKMQTLWNLCQELKSKRETLVEKMSFTQNYLDEQQSLISVELSSLRQNNDSLSLNVNQMASQLHVLHQHWGSYQNREHEHLHALQNRDQSFQDLILNFEALSAEAEILRVLHQHCDADLHEQTAPLFQELDKWHQHIESAYQQHLEVRVQQLDHPGAVVPESEAALVKCTEFLAEFEPSWNDLKTLLLEQSVGQSSDSAPSSDQVASLTARYQDLNAELNQMEAAAHEREKALQETFRTVQTIVSDFHRLRDSNQELSEELANINDQTSRLIEMVEAYRQAAIESAEDSESRIAAIEAERDQALAQSGASADTSSDDSSDSEASNEDANSKAEACRDAVRKKIAVVIRHRFGKLPRKLSSAMKNVTQSKKIDALFDSALACETLEAFETEVDALT